MSPRRARSAPTGLVLVALVILFGCASTPRRPSLDVDPGLKDPRKAARLHTAMENGAVQVGLASWYGPKFHGRSTASGERFDMDGLSAAHKTLPFGTIIRVANLDNGQALEVRVNDRGPFVRGRILDLSRAAAAQLGILGTGVARVELSLLAWPEEANTSNAELPPRAHGPWVQAGAFREAARAESLAASLRLHDRRFAVYSENGWHRVQARLATSREARKLIRSLRNRGIEAVAVRP